MITKCGRLTFKQTSHVSESPACVMQLQHDDGQTVVFQDGKAVRVSVRLEGKYQHEADAATPEELLLLLMDCHSDMRSALKGATLTSFKLERFQFRQAAVLAPFMQFLAVSLQHIRY